MTNLPDMKKACKKVGQNDLKAIKKRLEDGNQRYVDQDLQCFQSSEPRKPGQRPYAAVLSCSDSRVIPERIFDAGPGELFVSRVAGNVATEEIIASIEYAVAVLKTRVIVVLGHESCGAVDAAIDTIQNPLGKYATLGYNLDRLLSMIRPAVVQVARSAQSDKLNPYTIVKKNAKLNAEQLLQRSTMLSNPKKPIDVYYGYYNLGGKVVLRKLVKV